MMRLSDRDLARFVEQGFLQVDSGIDASVHRHIHQQIGQVFAQEGNPGNDILAKVPELWQVLEAAPLKRVLEGVLGPDYWVHPHRHCHLNPAGSPGQGLHLDSYEEDENVRHHRCRWAMAFYYPQDVDASMGPSSVVPGSHFYTESVAAQDEVAFCGPAGSVTVVHYELWHRAMANYSKLPRYMVKFLFCRMVEPTQRRGAADFAAGTAQDAMWNWFGGEPKQGMGLGKGQPDAVLEGDEKTRLQAAYDLAQQIRSEVTAVEVLIDALKREATLRLQDNMDRDHTNPSQLSAGLGLAACGEVAVAPLAKLLKESAWPTRAAAAAVLGDMGPAAMPALADLVPLVKDEQVWVRRNAVEALGVIAGEDAVEALAAALTDEDRRVRYNAALALGKIGPQAKAAGQALTAAAADENYLFNRSARAALYRLGTG
jgi:hypothetical protein